MFGKFRSHLPAVARAAAATVLEVLETRRLMSTVTPTDIDADGIPDLKITGTSGTDKINIYLDPAEGQTFVWDNKNGNSSIDSGELKYFPVNFETIDVATSKGTDTVNVYLLSNLGQSSDETYDATALPEVEVEPALGLSIYVDLGDGNDKFLFQSPTSLPPKVEQALIDAASSIYIGTAGGRGADIIEGGDLLIQVEGGKDKDTIEFDLSRTSIFGAEVLLSTDAGDGDDIVNLTLPDSTLGETIEEGVVSDPITEEFGFTTAHLSVAIDLGGGKNVLNLVNKTDILDDSTVFIDVDGGSSTDTINDLEAMGSGLVNMNLEAEAELPSLGGGGSYTLDVELGSGDDKYLGTFDFNQSASLFTSFTGSANYIIRGDSGKDTINAKDAGGDTFPASDSSEIRGLIDFKLFGMDGDDNVQLDLDPGSSLLVGPGGTFRANVDGGAGNDFVRIDVLVAETTLGNVDLTLLGGSGNDRLGFMFEGLGSLLGGNLGPRGYPLLDGGAGSDKYDTEGNITIVTRGAETLDDTIEPPYQGVI